MTDHDTRWTVTEAIAEAKKIKVKLSRPTVIKMCRSYDIGYQVVPGGNWFIFPEPFMKIVKGIRHYD